MVKARGRPRPLYETDAGFWAEGQKEARRYSAKELQVSLVNAEVIMMVDFVVEMQGKKQKSRLDKDMAKSG